MNFGTAGIRDIMGDGPDKLNLNTISLITLGFLKYLKSKKKISCVIGYDTRHNSKEFAIQSAYILSEYGINIYLFENSRPTPELSFAIKKLGADAGIMITASHNSKEYNGYKVYDNRGCQLLPEETKIIKDFIDNLIIHTDNLISKKNNVDIEIKNKNIFYINEKMDEDYINTVIPSGKNNDIKILYSPLHGTGLSIIPKALNYAGFNNISLISSQCVCNGEFSTVEIPNPEIPDTFIEALKYNDKNFDIVIITDPDADRVAIMQDSKIFSGDELGILLFYFLLSQGKRGKLVRSFVSNDLVDRIANKHSIDVIITPVGFKYIGDIMNEEIMFAFEDSCGYLHHNHVADKDAISTTVLICQMVQYYKRNGKLLKNVLDEIYEEYGMILNEKYLMTSSEVEFFIKKMKLSEFERIFDAKVYNNNAGNRVIIRKSGTEDAIKVYNQIRLE